MPIYEYQCGKCSHRFEIIQPMGEKETPPLCPRCGNQRTERLISSFSCGTPKQGATDGGSGCAPRPGRFS